MTKAERMKIMKSGTEKKSNPHEVSLGKFLTSLQRWVSSKEYMKLANGQIVRRGK